MAKTRWGMASLKRAWEYLEIDKHTALMMLKGGLPPTIMLAMLQSSSFAGITQSYGYFAVTVSILSQALLPRALFMKVMLFNVIAICCSGALCVLAIFCAVRARENTTPPGTPAGDYNSSAAAVSAIWFLFSIWLGSTIRTYLPRELQIPMVVSSIFVAVVIPQAPQIATFPAGLSLVRNIIIVFMLGFSVATAVAVFILPLTSRGKLFQAVNPYPKAVKAVLDAEVAYIKSSEKDGPWRLTRLVSRQRSRVGPRLRRSYTPANDKGQTGAGEFGLDKHAIALKSAMDHLSSIQSGAHKELTYAKQEIAWGKLTPEDLQTFHELLRSLFLSLSGIGMLPEVFRKLTKAISRADAAREASVPWNQSAEQLDDESPYENTTSEMHFIQPLCERLESAATLVYRGLQHTFIQLELAKPKEFSELPRRRRRRAASFTGRDEETPEDRKAPGGVDFTRDFEERRLDHYERRKHLPHTWASLNAFVADTIGHENLDSQAVEDYGIRKEFFAIVFLVHLQDVLLKAATDLVKFADLKVSEGKMGNRVLIFPKREYLRQWLFTQEPEKDEDDGGSHSRSGRAKRTKFHPYGVDPIKSQFADPEHMPPANKLQKLGNRLRRISSILTSEESIFGFRVAVASFSAAILVFLHDTQNFFYNLRVNWVVIVIVIGMIPTSGRSLFGFIGRVIGTSGSMGLALAVWYMVVGNTAGVIVLSYVANCFQCYFYIKFPRSTPAAIIALTTFNLIIANQLQNRKMGLATSTTGQLVYYPIYLFGPYRLVEVCIGCAISYFWTIFPSPTTAGSQMRKNLGRSLFVLANFYSCMHSSIKVWMNEEQGDTNDPWSPGRLLDRARNKLFAEEMALLSSLRADSDFTKFDMNIGGRFPKRAYDSICSGAQTIVTSMALMAHSTRDLERLSGRTGLSRKSSSHSEHPSAPRWRESEDVVEKATNGAEGSGPGPSNEKQRNSDSTSQNSAGSTESDVSEGSGDSEQDENSEGDEMWIRNLARAASEPGFNPNIITSVLYQLSAAVSSGLSLPPYLTPPNPFPLARNLRQIDVDLLDIRNIENPSFSAFVAVEVLSTMVSSNLKALVADVKILVGELDFDIYVRHHRHRMLEEQQDAAGKSH